NKPSELMPELQGRFPIRVELKDLSKEDFVRILTEPKGALTKQYVALMETEGVQLAFEPDAIEALADFAFTINRTMQNIGARRLYTILEHLLEDISFEAPDMKMGDMKMGKIAINAAYVKDRLSDVADDEDLSKFIL
ncbi:MAG: HslU--HslV peptidase ATPase subunit, partial [Planctomycetota bacterium]|nr:HslU--HslV peptidase ATPase subunit [Planctomycetota bacterium]